MYNRTEEIRGAELKSMQKPFSFGLKDYKGRKILRSSKSVQKSEKKLGEGKTSLRSFENQRIKTPVNFQPQFQHKIVYRAHIAFQEITEGNCFCARALLSEDSIRKKIIVNTELREPKICKKYELLRRSVTSSTIQPAISMFAQAEQPEEETEMDGAQKEQLMAINSQEIDDQLLALMASQLSIIANSATVRILSLPKLLLSSLSEPTQKALYEHIEDNLFIDADRPFRSIRDLKEKVNEHQQWDSYKQDLREQKIKDII